MSLEDIVSPLEQFVAFIEERENIRARRASGKPWPWTKEPILQTYRFTNIHREDDAVSKHYQKTVRDRYGEDKLVFPATILYRWFNRISTCDALFNEPDFTNQSVYERYIGSREYSILSDQIKLLPTPHVTGAYLIVGKPGFTKGEGVLQYFHDWCAKEWAWQWDYWQRIHPTLQEVYDWIMSPGLGTFMTAQLVADLKYLPMFQLAPDWWTFAAPGPGSMRGLNIVYGFDIDQRWRLDDWLMKLNTLNDYVTPMLSEIGIEKLHNQDLQNCLCEFSKFTKVARGIGRPRQIYRHVG